MEALPIKATNSHSPDLVANNRRLAIALLGSTLLHCFLLLIFSAIIIAGADSRPDNISKEMDTFAGFALPADNPQPDPVQLIERSPGSGDEVLSADAADASFEGVGLLGIINRYREEDIRPPLQMSSVLCVIARQEAERCLAIQDQQPSNTWKGIFLARSMTLGHPFYEVHFLDKENHTYLMVRPKESAGSVSDAIRHWLSRGNTWGAVGGGLHPHYPVGIGIARSQRGICIYVIVPTNRQ